MWDCVGQLHEKRYLQVVAVMFTDPRMRSGLNSAWRLMQECVGQARGKIAISNFACRMCRNVPTKVGRRQTYILLVMFTGSRVRSGLMTGHSVQDLQECVNQLLENK